MKIAEQNLDKAENQQLNIGTVIGSYGYYQKGNRYHWRINGELALWLNSRVNKHNGIL